MPKRLRQLLKEEMITELDEEDGELDLLAISFLFMAAEEACILRAERRQKRRLYLRRCDLLVNL